MNYIYLYILYMNIYINIYEIYLFYFQSSIIIQWTLPFVKEKYGVRVEGDGEGDGKQDEKLNP